MLARLRLATCRSSIRLSIESGGTGVPEPGAVLGIVDPSAGNGSSRWLTS
ncbi:Uncharacterised protein [Mycobacterium tuberculosis]|nr:Uncharacterised protein [Mycobacterium tuberculosis]